MNSIPNYLKYLLFMPVLLLGGCIEDSLSDCEPEDEIRRLLVINVEDVLTGEDITSVQELENVRLYLFDSNGEYYNAIDVPVEDIRNKIPIDITDTGIESGYATVWSNLSDFVTISQAEQTRINIDRFALDITENTIERGFYNFPGDLFFGYRPFDFSNSTRATVEKVRYVPVERVNARLYVTVRGLEQTDDTEKYYLKYETMWTGYDFTGNPREKERMIREPGVFHVNGDFTSEQAAFMIHCPDDEDEEMECVTVHLMQRADSRASDITIISGSRDTYGNNIRLESGKTTNVLFVLEDGRLEISTVITPWDEIYQWETW